MGKWVINFNGLLWTTVDIGVDVVHANRVIATYAVEIIIFPHIDNTQYTDYN